MAYLLKVTIAWTVFLLLFELFYKGNGKYTANRMYIMLTLAIGLLLPLIPVPSKAPAVVIGTVENLNEVMPAQEQQIVYAPTITATQNVHVVSQSQPFDWWSILYISYAIVTSVLLIKTLVELGKVILLIRTRPTYIINGEKVITTDKLHAPYSFMGYIFITNNEGYDADELNYIIQHEAAHNTAKHWMDLLLMQLACIALWFHPLVWRYRYLLRMQHEYQADAEAACTDPYTYGHFLLQQTLLNGVPSIAHSFHFSPIKNRIDMLTKNQGSKLGGWKYLLTVPILVACSLLMASTNDNAPTPNATIFRDHVVTWRESDTLLFDLVEKKARLVDQYNKTKRSIVTSMDGEMVYENEHLKHPARYGNGIYNEGYFNYLNWAFHDAVKNTADSSTGLGVTHVVIGKDGAVVHYNVQYYKWIRHKKYWDPYFGIEPVLNSIVDKIITDGPKWQPAIVDGKAVLSVVNSAMPGC